MEREELLKLIETKRIIGVDLSGEKLERIDFTGCTLERVNFKGCISKFDSWYYKNR